MGFHCLNTGEIYQLLAAFRSTFYTGTVHIHWQFIFEIIWFLLISDELIIIICLTLSWLWCWCRFMSASPGFHSGYWAVPALIGIHAFPPSLSCESFWVLSTVHSFTFTFIFVIVITELNFFAWVLSSSSYHSTWTLCTPPHQHNHAHPISVCNTFSCVWQKVHLARLNTAEDTMSWYMKWYCTRINKKVILKREKPSSYCFWFHIWPIRP